MTEGTIKKLMDKGFGFISTSEHENIFFHMSSLNGVNFDSLYEGQTVTFTKEKGPKGTRAENVTPA